MAQVLLSAVGGAVGGPLGAVLGATLGAAADRAALAALSPARAVGPRIPELRVATAAEGAPMACVFGRARVAGQVIWAARFTESRVEGRVGGAKGAKTVSHAYSLSFAVALGEGPIDGIGRVWADGKPLDLTTVAARLHLGDETQTPDPLIEAVDGAAPAYRGVAYLVFEDLALEPFGHRPPSISVEVFRRPRGPGLEEALTSVCLIPGAGEFVYADQVVLRRESLTRATPENLNNTDGRADLMVSLDQLQAQLPRVDHVTLVVAWFGDDLRCGHCQIRPGVDQAVKDTSPASWRVGGVDRDDAHRVSRHGGGAAYGGTPSDASVLAAIAELKRRGLAVSLYPFVLMDVPPDNALPDPHGGPAQGAYPWRGRITCHPAPGRPGSPDGTAAAAAAVAAFFGPAQAGDFGVADGLPTYDGPAGWGLSRLVLHYAKLAAVAGGVESLVIGSELRGLTTTRDGPGAYPAVAALRALAAQARAVVGPEVKLGYAADWSEYFGHQPADGSGDLHFHLDPLWADPAIDFVGVDFYPPLGDWRDGDAHLDAQAGFAGPDDPAYLAANLAGGEGHDWFYPTAADRLAQARAPITDGAHGEPWVFRPKALADWWAHPHHDRPGGARAAVPTAWTPRGKPLRLVEFGCPAVDKGANAPNLFSDPKSSESALPPFSTGARDDLMQRRTLEAVLAWLADPAANPVSPVYGGPMIERASAWCWDARPFPDFPARTAVWADGPNWTLGHWLNGRVGAAPLGALAVAIAARAGVALDPGEAGGVVAGYVIDRPMRVRDALAPLAEAFGLDAVERGAGVRLTARSGLAAAALVGDDLAWPPDAPAPDGQTRALAAPIQALRLRFIDVTRDYQAGALSVRREAGAGSADAEAPIVLDPPEAERVARRMLGGAAAAGREIVVHLAPLAALRLEVGDRVSLAAAAGVWRVERLDHDERPRATLRPCDDPAGPVSALDWSLAPALAATPPPAARLLDLPPLAGAETDIRPLVAVAAAPWRPFELHAGPSPTALRPRGRAEIPATLGETLSALPPGPRHRFDPAARLTVRLEGAAPRARDRAAVLAGDNQLAVLGPDGEWRLLGFCEAQAVGPETWTLSGLLRGAVPALAAGAPAVLVDAALVRAEVAQAERDLPLTWRVAPAGGPPAGAAMTELTAVWRGLALRPLSPAHLRGRRMGDDLVVGWIRRTRLHGDGWAAEVPLGEEREVYRVEVLDGASVVRRVEVTVPAFTYAAAMRAADFPVPGAPARLRVAQGSAIFGWGAAAELLL